MKPVNFESHIHNELYRNEYYSREITAGSWIAGHGVQTESLNGNWRYAVDQFDTCLRARWFEEKPINREGHLVPLDYDFDHWREISVPLSWNTAEKELFLYEGPVVYTRNFSIRAGSGERVFLKFHGIQYEGFIFVNRRYLGCHRGGSTGFCVEITDILEENNRLLVVADNTRRSHQVPALNTDWFNYGGIYRDVELLRLPETLIKTCRIQLLPGSGAEKIQVALETDGPLSGGKGRIRIPDLHIDKEIPVEKGTGSLVFSASPELWSPDSPRLYRCTVTFGKDRVIEDIGFREISVSGNEILLNGKKIFLKGISCHEDTVSGGKYVSPEEVEQEMLIARELGCNYMRLAHYPHSETAARTADRLGLLLWEEIPVYWAIDFTGPKTFEDAENQLRELIRRDINRASVIIWSVGNENADTDERLNFMKGLAESARREDPSRLISAACLVDYVNNRINDRLAGHLDVIGLNEYFGWYDPDFTKLPDLLQNSRPDKPVVISETGAGAKAGHHGSRDEFFTEEKQKYVYEQQIGMLSKIPYIQGMTPWILFDFRCPRRTNILQDGYNRKGLLDETRTRRKSAFYVLQEFYRSRS